MGTIIVGMDTSPNAAVALRWAAGESGRRGWTVRAVLCWGYLDQHHASGAEFDPGYRAADAQAALDASVAAAVGESAAEHVDRQLINERPARGLLESSAGADLLVLGARGLGGLKGMLLGSVSRQCLHHNTVPVVIVKDEQAPAPSGRARVVAGVDGSESSLRALAWAVETARARDARVAAVSTWTPPNVGELFVVAGPSDRAAFEAAAAEILAAAVDTVDAGGLEAPIEQLVVAGAAGSVIVAQSEDADLVVVGSRGRGGFTGLLLGSVSDHVAHHAVCPVVVVPRAH
jgi:nucleotide-binding universal stress UspA family protein